MEISVFLDITPCSPLKANPCFVGTFRLNFQGRRIRQARNQHEARSKSWWHASSEISVGFQRTNSVLSQKTEIFTIISYEYLPSPLIIIFPSNSTPRKLSLCTLSLNNLVIWGSASLYSLTVAFVEIVYDLPFFLGYAERSRTPKFVSKTSIFLKPFLTCLTNLVNWLFLVVAKISLHIVYTEILRVQIVSQNRFGSNPFHV
jgi:hypothetical protein